MNLKRKMPYPVGSMLHRLLRNVTQKDRSLYATFAVYTLTASIYPLFAVLLPKLLIQQLSLPNPSIDSVWKIVLLFLLCASVFGIAKTWLHDRDYERLTFLRMDYIRESSEKMLRMDYANVEDSTFYDRNGRAMDACSSNYNGLELVYHMLYETPTLVLTALALSVLLCMLSPWALVGLLAQVIVSYAVGRSVHAYEYRRQEEQQHARRKMEYYYRTTHDFSFGKDIRLYGFRERVLANYRKVISDYVAIFRQIRNKEYLLGFCELASLLASDCILYGILVWRTVQGMTIADFSMYLAAAVALSVTLKSCTQNLNKILNEGHYAWDFFTFMDTDIGEKGGPLPAIQGDTLEIEFKNMSFRYPNTDRYIFKNLDFTIHKGEKLAIVGVNGAGKSTLVKLMTGLFAPMEGDICISGLPIGSFGKDALYSMFSVVFQEVNTLAFTIRENVACSSELGNDDKVWDALDRAGLGDKVRTFPAGLDQVLLKVIDEQGTELSGGENQKLAIARALYENSNMVIMDEPTAALDALAEADIYQRFDELIAGKTAVYVSHRLASTKFCDKIAFFDGDGLREYGSHRELMDLQGAYYTMFTVQGKYYNEEASADEKH